ncbi:MAG: hypothetical protein U1E46_13810 [Hyphomicrobiales bacterium]
MYASIFSSNIGFSLLSPDGGGWGHRTRSLGVEHFGQTGTLRELYRHYGIDAHAILEAADGVVRTRPARPAVG